MKSRKQKAESRIWLLALLSVFLGSVVLAADLEVQVRNHVSGTVNNRRVALKLQQPGSVVAGPWLVAGDFVVQRTETNGITVFSNVLAGDYSLTIYGSPERSFVFTVPDTNAYVNVVSLTGTNSTPVYYTASQVDALLAAVEGGGGGSSLWVTSGDQLYPSGTTGTSGGWTADSTQIHPE
jgi:hypothetical protein